MINPIDIFNIEYVKNAFAIVWVLTIFWYISIRVLQKPFQKKNWLSNIDFWVFHALQDMYRDYWYPDHEKYALKMTKQIQNAIINDTLLVRKKPLWWIENN